MLDSLHTEQKNILEALLQDIVIYVTSLIHRMRHHPLTFNLRAVIFFRALSMQHVLLPCLVYAA
jgi:hypothetical protein